MVKKEWESSTTRKRQHTTQFIVERPSVYLTVKEAASTTQKSAANVPHTVPQKKEYSDRMYNVCGTLMIVLGVILALLGLFLLLAVPVGGIVAVAVGVICVIIGRKYRKIVKERHLNE